MLTPDLRLYKTEGRNLDEDPGFELLKKIITENTGFNCEYYKEAHFRRRINVRVRATNSESYGAYLKILKKIRGNMDIWLRRLL